MATQTSFSTKSPVSNTTDPSPSYIWEIHEWNETGSNTVTIASVSTLKETTLYVDREVSKIQGAGEGHIFHKNIPQHVKSGKLHCVYELPDENKAPNRVKLMRTCNSEIITGLVACRKFHK